MSLYRDMLTRMLERAVMYWNALDDLEWQMNKATFDHIHADLLTDTPFPERPMSQPSVLGLPVNIVENIETGYVLIQQRLTEGA